MMGAIYYLFLLSILVNISTCNQGISYMLGYTFKDSPSNSKILEGWLGRPLDIIGTTITMTSYWVPIYAPYKISAAVPMLSISGWDNAGATDMAKAATGSYDQYYQGQANAFAKVNASLHSVRLGWEMNGNWYPWSVTGSGGTNQTWDNYIATFRRMANIFRTTIPGVKIEFCANWAYQNYGSSGNLTQYWPGSEYVDIISLDVYQADLGNEWNYAMSGGSTSAINLNWIVNFAQAQGVKVALSEWGASNDDATYITNATKWMNDLGNLFDYSVYSQYEPADQVVYPGNNSKEQSAWISGWGNTYYSPPVITTEGLTSSSRTTSPLTTALKSSVLTTSQSASSVLTTSKSALTTSQSAYSVLTTSKSALTTSQSASSVLTTSKSALTTSQSASSVLTTSKSALTTSQSASSVLTTSKSALTTSKNALTTSQSASSVLTTSKSASSVLTTSQSASSVLTTASTSKLTSSSTSIETVLTTSPLSSTTSSPIPLTTSNAESILTTSSFTSTSQQNPSTSSSTSTSTSTLISSSTASSSTAKVLSSTSSSTTTSSTSGNAPSNITPSISASSIPIINLFLIIVLLASL